MIGDVNLFFNEPDNARLAEVEVMIAGMISMTYQVTNITRGLLVAEVWYIGICMQSLHGFVN